MAVQEDDLDNAERRSPSSSVADAGRPEQSVDPLGTLSVTVRSYERWSGGYVCFVLKVSVSERSWAVGHRYSDFVALRLHVEDEFYGKPDIKVPMLPPKRFFNRFDPKFLQQRQAGLQSFLDEAMPLLIDYDSKALKKFLDIDAHLEKNVAAMSRLYKQGGGAGSGGSSSSGGHGNRLHHTPPAPTESDRERIAGFRIKQQAAAAATGGAEPRPFLTIDTIRRAFGYADFAKVKGTPAQQHAAAVIQKHVRGRQASNETRRRHQWKVFRELDLSEDADMLALACFFHTLVDELDYTKLLPEINDSSAAAAAAAAAAAGRRELALPRDVATYTGIYAEDEDGKFRLPPGPLSDTARAAMLLEALQCGYTISRRVAHQVLVEAYDLLRSQPNLRHVSIPDPFEVAAGRAAANGSANGKLTRRPSRSKVAAVAAPAVTVTVLGDIHGQLADLLHVLDAHGMPSTTNKYIFNGDFVDRGPSGVEIVLLLYSLLLAFPDCVFLNRGNHEDVFLSHAYGFREEVRKKYGELTFNMFAETFRYLPIATIINKEVFVVHGGLFHRTDVLLAHLERIPRAAFTPDARIKEPPDTSIAFDPSLHSEAYVPPRSYVPVGGAAVASGASSVLTPAYGAASRAAATAAANGKAPGCVVNAAATAVAAAAAGAAASEQPTPMNPRVRDELKEIMRDALWSDPTEEHEGVGPPIRGTGVCFGRDAVKAFLQLNGLHMVVRSHECVPDGYLRIMPGPELGSPGMLATVFSASNYCGAGNDGAVMKFHMLGTRVRGPSPTRPLGATRSRNTSAKKLSSNASISSMDSGQATPTPAMGSGQGGLVAEGSRLRFTVWTHYIPADSGNGDEMGGGSSGSGGSVHAAGHSDERAVMAREKEEGLERKNEVTLKGLLLKKREELKAAFEKADPQGTGHISRLQWAEVMEGVMGIKASWMLLLPKLVKEDFLRPSEDGEILVNYRAYMDEARQDQMDLCAIHGQDLLDFRNTFFDALYAHKDKLEVIFKFFDKNGDGIIDQDEFVRGCEFINTLLPPELRLRDVAKLPRYMHARTNLSSEQRLGQRSGVDINSFFEASRLAESTPRGRHTAAVPLPPLLADDGGAAAAAAAAAGNASKVAEIDMMQVAIAAPATEGEGQLPAAPELPPLHPPPLPPAGAAESAETL